MNRTAEYYLRIRRARSLSRNVRTLLPFLYGVRKIPEKLPLIYRI